MVATVGGLAGLGGGSADPVLVGTGTIQILQYALLAAGTAGSVYTARRITRARHHLARRQRAVLRPYAALILLLGGLNAVLFALPMAHRM